MNQTSNSLPLQIRENIRQTTQHRLQQWFKIQIRWWIVVFQYFYFSFIKKIENSLREGLRTNLGKVVFINGYDREKKWKLTIINLLSISLLDLLLCLGEAQVAASNYASVKHKSPPLIELPCSVSSARAIALHSCLLCHLNTIMGS